jgi:hypothetical protein
MTTYKAKSSAVRAAKKLHGDNWAEMCNIVPGVDGFTVETLRIHDDSEATRLKMVEELTAGLKALDAVETPVKVVELTQTGNTKSLGGRPISANQTKTRRSLVTFINAQNGQEFTVKQARKKLKMKLMHVSNAMRWAESTGLVVRMGYKVDEVKRPGRRELIFKAVAVEQKQAA